MFRSTGRPKTAINVICNVAWASSLGGLCLLAEERRRRLVLAQKILENGKKLQAYKSYTAAAAVAAFDLGEDWNPDLPNLEADEDIPRNPVGQALTNDEWRSRGRHHRSIPTATPPSPSQSQFSPWRGCIFENLALPPLCHVPIRIPGAAEDHNAATSQDPTVSFQVRKLVVEDETIGKQDSAGGISNTIAQKFSPQVDPSNRERSKYALHLQEIVAQRVIECLGSDNTNLRFDGYQELSAFFERFRNHTSPLMKEAVKLALSAHEVSTANNAAFEARQHMKRQWKLALKTPSGNQFVGDILTSTSAKSPIRYSSPRGLNLEVPEARFTRQIRSGLDAQHLDDAFYGFLALCEQATEPISRATRKLIRELSFAYKSLGLYSVVMDIQKKTLQSLKEWRLLYADMAWLMDHASPKNNVEFCWEAVQSFLSLDGMGEDSRVNLCLRFLQWFLAKNQPEQGISLFTKMFRPGYIECDAQQLKDVAQELYDQAVHAQLFEQADGLLSWFAEHNLTLSGNLLDRKTVLDKLIGHGQLAQAAKLYIALRDCYADSQDAIQLLNHLKNSDPTFEQILYDHCNTLICVLHRQQEYNAITNLSHILDDHSKLPPSTTVLFYHAFAMVGPLIEAKRTVDGLLRANICLLQDIVHDSHSILVKRCWKISRNFKMTEDLFQSVRAVGFQQARSTRTFNSMILACVEAGKLDTAQQYMEELINGARLKPDLETWSYLMLGKALSKDWEGVSDYIKSAQLNGDLPSRGGFDGTFFDAVFVEFCKQHNADRVVRFAIDLTNPDLLTITHRMAENVVDIIVQSEDIDLLRLWVQHMHSRGCTPFIGKESVARILNRITQSKKLKFHPNLSEAQHLHTTQGALDVPQLLDHLNAVNTQQGPDNNALEQKSKPIKIRHRESRRATERTMINALSKEQPLEALRVYKKSLVHGLPQQQVDLELAVRASLTINPQSNVEALALIEDAKLAGLNTDRSQTPLLLHSLQRRSLTEEEAHKTAFDFYHSVDESRISLHHHVTIAVVRNLNNNGNAAGALRVLKAVHDSEYAQRKPFDLSAMTMCLRLLLQTGNIDGVDWVVRTVLDRNLRIDKIFVHTLHDGLQAGQRKMERSKYFHQDVDGRNSSWTEALTRHIATIRARRDLQREDSLKFAKQTIQVLQLEPESIQTSRTKVSRPDEAAP